MTAPADDGFECFRELIRILRVEDFGVTACRLDSLFHIAWTTSSEFVGELGREILAFQRCGYEPYSPELRRSLDTCMSLVRRIGPDIR